MRILTVTLEDGTLSHAKESVPLPCAEQRTPASVYAVKLAGAGETRTILLAVMPVTLLVQDRLDQSVVAMVTVVVVGWRANLPSDHAFTALKSAVASIICFCAMSAPIKWRR